MLRGFPFVLSLALLAVACSDPEAGLLDFKGVGGDFTLRDQTGHLYSLAEHKGDIRILFFGFTYCPDICPTTLTELQEVYSLLGESGKDVKTLFVSVDPERDTPAQLANYLSRFSIPVVGLTGSLEQVELVAKAFGAFFEKIPLDSAAGYTLDHSTRSYLIDGEGQVRYIFRYEDSPERIAHVVRKLLP